MPSIAPFLLCEPLIYPMQSTYPKVTSNSCSHAPDLMAESLGYTFQLDSHPCLWNAPMNLAEPAAAVPPYGVDLFCEHIVLRLASLLSEWSLQIAYRFEKIRRRKKEKTEGRSREQVRLQGRTGFLPGRVGQTHQRILARSL